MKEKTLKYLCLSVISIYFLFGLFFFGMDKDVNSKGQHLENSKGQEIAFKMNELEKEVMKRIHTIDQQKKDNILDSDTLLSEIENSRQYLQDHFAEENITNETSLNLLYHSSLLTSLGEYYEIDDNNLPRVSRAIHSSTIDQLCGGLNADMEKQLKEEIKKLTKEQSVELVKVILA